MGFPNGPGTRAGGTCHCRHCGSPLSETFVDLGMSPLVQSFVQVDRLDEMEPYFPLHVMVCSDCRLVQLRDYVSPAEIFCEYAYFSSYSPSWVEHARLYCEMIARRLGLHENSRVVEIAANDGYLLQHFLPLGIPVLGIEPAANVADAARAKGIPIVGEFFGLELAQQLVAEGRPADLIIGNNVFAHVPDLNDFVAGLKRLLAPEGVVTLEFPHLERLMVENQFDTIYHEHFSYFSLLTAQRVVRHHGLDVFDVEELPTHGGSLRIYLTHADSSAHARAPRVDMVLERERHAGFEGRVAYTRFGERVRQSKRNLLSALIALKNENKCIAGYGAPGKGNTLLNYCGIGTDFLDFTVDRNPYKHGLYTPGMHIPILPVEMIDEMKPDYLLILPWNLKSEIMEQMKHIADWGGRFIVPIPEVEIIDPRGPARP
ncbi:class I SAM-dependent methyltransferase [Aquabacter sp. CN5-332]|uniref:class I SAM-dependent methyltransferase n=1 Tax=Aquabacter sp. CN5-332 TaxID=3156608 RepID=UPI0032B4E8FD